MSATSRAGRAMAGGLRRRRLLGVSPGTLAARHAQAIERALDLGDQPGRNAGEPSSPASGVRAAPESPECPCRAPADGSRSCGEAYAERAFYAAPRLLLPA